MNTDDTTKAANKIVAWIGANKTHVFAVAGAALAGAGYFLKILSWEQAVAVATACGGFSWLQNITNTQTKQIKEATGDQTEHLNLAADLRADHINEVSETAAAAAVTAIRPDVHEEAAHTKIKQAVAKKVTKPHARKYHEHP
jgi:hypothetical protein